jgi:FkbM family methyltransferase
MVRLLSDVARRLYGAFAVSVFRPYIRREMPGWGRLYRAAIGDYQRDWLWRGHRPRWVRGKLHAYEMQVKIGGWSNRATFFLERFYDLPTQLLIKQTLKPGGCFVDIGANEGMMSLMAARSVGPAGRVIAFEPNPVPRAVLEANVSRNGLSNVDVRPFGLADAPATLKLFVPSINTGEGTFARPGYDESDGTYVECRVAVGDDELRGVNPTLIKIDVEGFELHVIEGLRSTIERTKPPIVMEMVADHLARAGHTPIDICARLEALGYAGQKLTLTSDKRLGFEPMPTEWADGDYLWRPKA